MLKKSLFLYVFLSSTCFATSWELSDEDFESYLESLPAYTPKQTNEAIQAFFKGFGEKDYSDPNNLGEFYGQFGDRVTNGIWEAGKTDKGKLYAKTALAGVAASAAVAGGAAYMASRDQNSRNARAASTDNEETAEEEKEIYQKYRERMNEEMRDLEENPEYMEASTKEKLEMKRAILNRISRERAEEIKACRERARGSSCNIM